MSNKKDLQPVKESNKKCLNPSIAQYTVGNITLSALSKFKKLLLPTVQNKK